ncbi:sensor histidine kinase [Kitasatospora gansuensis]
MEQLLQRLSASKRVTWLMSQAVVLATAGLYALILALTMLPTDWAHYDGLFRFPGLDPFQMLGLCVLLALPVLLVRRLPAAVFAAVLGEAVLGDAFGARPLIVFVLLVGLGGYLAARRPKAAAVGSVAAVVAAFFNCLHGREQTVSDASQWAGQFALWFAVAWVFGQVYRKRREYLEALQEQTGARVVMAERLRIARELHDSVAHSIGIITVLSGAAARVVETKPEQARQALTGIETTSRETLLELQRMLGALRRAEPDDAMPQAAPLAPWQPGRRPAARRTHGRRRGAGSGDLAGRAASVAAGDRAVGVPDRPGVGDERGAAFQGANVPGRGWLRAGRGDDRGGGRRGRRSWRAGPSEALRGRGSGFGLLGMRERVTLLSGQFSAGQRPEGGFRVTARLPA